ncbi:hypothetical protein FHR32_006469 [Streptosporangium album]|uniref:Uncharacterized protein n=1 Tax=Streptosporangium album TaxID=47479 RepID=A0A7W7S2L6_9ACTN|nr:hypothetical protein [Streptosporangium album]MBB4942083.1 hypothetical protein [Streptosporangium album]
MPSSGVPAPRDTPPAPTSQISLFGRVSDQQGHPAEGDGGHGDQEHPGGAQRRR